MHVRCDNTQCEYNTDDQRCNASVVYYHNRLCITFRKRQAFTVRELMRTFDSNCSKTQRGYRSKRTGKVLK